MNRVYRQLLYAAFSVLVLLAALGCHELMDELKDDWKNRLRDRRDLRGGTELALYPPIVRGNTVTINGSARVPVRLIRWTWGDETASATASFPGTHSYAHDGTYDVMVHVDTEDGRTLVASTRVAIRGTHPPVEELTLHRPIIQGHEVTIGGSCRSPIATIRWNWGDGEATGTATFPGRHVYRHPGNYTVIVEVDTQDGRTLRGTAPVRIDAPPPHALRLTLQPPEVVGLTATIDGSLNAPLKEVYWNWGDGKTSRTAGFPASHTYPHPGAFNVSATAHSHDGRVGTASTRVVVQESHWPGLGNVIHLLPPSVQGLRVSVGGVLRVPVNQILWRWGDGQTTQDRILPAVHVYQRPGMYTLSVEVHPTSGGVVRSRVNVLVGTPWPGLDPDKLVLATPVVAGLDVWVHGDVKVPIENIRWVWGDGEVTDTKQFPVRHTYKRPGTYTIRVFVSPKSGAPLRASAEVEVGEAGPATRLGRPVVDGLEATINGSCDQPIRVIRWVWGDEKTTYTTAFPGKHLYQRPGTYEVEATVFLATGNPIVLRTQVVVGADGHMAPLSLNEPIVQGRSVTIGGVFRPRIPIKEMLWTWGDGTVSKTQSFPGRHVYQNAGLYEIVLIVEVPGNKVFRAATQVRVR